MQSHSPVTKPPARPLGRSEAIADKLALAIHEQRLLPGTKLGEDELGEIYGVSRTIVRTALLSLSHACLVEMRPNRGAFVAAPSLKEAREVFEARIALEPRTARRAAERATEADIARLKAHCAQEHEALDAGDGGLALRLSGQFHIEISQIADQEIIADFIAGLVTRSSLVIALYRRSASALCESHHHDRLIDALAAGDGAKAEALMDLHLVELLDALDLQEAPQEGQSLKDILGG